MLLGTDDVCDLIDDSALANDPRGKWSLYINSVDDFCHYKTPTRELQAFWEDYDFEMSRFFESWELLEFEVPFANSEHALVLDSAEVLQWERPMVAQRRRTKTVRSVIFSIHWI